MGHIVRVGVASAGELVQAILVWIGLMRGGAIVGRLVLIASHFVMMLAWYWVPHQRV